MGVGAGSLFTLRGEISPDLPAERSLAFLTKPRDMPYAEFYARVPSDSGTSLWRRTMVLGPTPEFALLAPRSAQDLDQFHPVRLELSPIWPA